MKLLLKYLRCITTLIKFVTSKEETFKHKEIGLFLQQSGTVGHLFKKSARLLLID